MAYRFKRDEAVADGVLRIARGQSRRALRGLETAAGAEQLEAVFDCRKRCKKVRAVARLIRPLLGSEYDEVNRCFREVGRLLGPYRDPHARLAGFDLLVAQLDETPPEMMAIQGVLQQQAQTNAAQLALDHDVLGRVDELLRVGELRLDRWQIKAEGWDAIEPGLVRNYRQATSALELARSEPTPYNIHEFRKYAKYFRNHLRLLEPSSPSELGPAVADLRDLTTTLGHAHDMADLANYLRTERPSAASFEPTSDPSLDGSLQQVLAVIAQRQHRLECEGLDLADRLFNESPKKLAARLGGLWKTWPAPAK